MLENLKGVVYKILLYLLGSFVIFFSQIKELLVSVMAAIFLDTVTGIFRSYKKFGYKSITSRRLADVVGKVFVYGMSVIVVFLVDRLLVGEFTFKWVSVEYLFTKIISVALVFIEFTSIKENFEEAFDIDILKLLKNFFENLRELKIQFSIFFENIKK